MTEKVNVRDLALKVLYSIHEEDAYSNLALGEVLRRYSLSRQDRALLTELVYGVLRWRGTLDYYLSHVLTRPLQKLEPRVRDLLRLGAYQILFLSKIPVPAAVNEAVKLARKYGHEGIAAFVNGVLRNLDRRRQEISFPDPEDDPAGYLAVRYSHPRWLVEKWLAELGFAATEKICRANNEIPPNTIRTNTLKISREELAHHLKEEGLEVSNCRFAPEGLKIKGFTALTGISGWREGYFTIQDEGSMLVARALAPAAGATVIDACSAPGGKTTHLAQLMGNEGRIVAADLHPHKLELVEESCRRLGVKIVEVVAADARELPARFKGQADYILVDAPCTGLGVLRRKPEIRWRKGGEKVAELARLNGEILDAMAECLKPGGVLVYSTCTVSAAENQEVVAAFCRRHPEFCLDDLSPFLGEDLLQSLTYGQPGSGMVQILPGEEDMDGFFIARLRKR